MSARSGPRARSLPVPFVLALPVLLVTLLLAGSACRAGGSGGESGSPGGSYPPSADPPSGSGPDDSQLAGPAPHPHLADSTWPTMHRDPYARSVSPEPGPAPGEELAVQLVDLAEAVGDGPVWTVTGEPYPDGSVPVWTATLLRVAKGVVDAAGLRLVDEVSFDELAGEREGRDPRLIDGGRWNLLVAAGNRLVVLDAPRRELLVLRDADPAAPDSPMTAAQRWRLTEDVPGRPFALNLTYDGHLVVLTDEGCLGAARLADLVPVASHCIDLPAGEGVMHNQFVVDEGGAVYLVGRLAMRRVDWTGERFEPVWTVPYDSTGEGINGRLGSGTTPTLVGGAGDEDRLVVVVDAATPNNLVAFWRDEVPGDWPGLPGQDRRVAAVTALPAATPERNRWSVENSPVAHGYDVAVAQYNGLQPGLWRPCRSEPGVQRLRWDPRQDRFELVWVNEEVGLHGVLTLSTATGLLYGSGLDGCRYAYYGLDWDTGEPVLVQPLGRGLDYTDGGNQQTLLGDGSIAFGGGRGWVRVHQVGSG